MIRPAIFNDAFLRHTNMALTGLGAFVGLAAVGLGLGLLLAKSSASSARRDRTAALQREEAAKATIARAEKVPPRTIPSRTDQQLEAFGSTLAAACLEEQVKFTNFDSGSEPTGFTTRYAGTIEGADWKAAEARVTIQGRLADIYTVLGKLKGHPVPFEVVAGALDNGVDGGEVRGTMTLAVIVREEKNASRG